VALAAVLLVGCQSLTQTETPQPLPTPFPEIATTPSFQSWVTQRVLSFRESAPGALPLGFGLQIRPLEAGVQQVEEGEFSLLVSPAEAPGGWFVTPVGWEGIVFVVHPENRVRGLDREQLVAIFSGLVGSWDELGGTATPVEPIIPLAHDELREALEEILMDGRPFSSGALLGPTPELTLSLVGKHPGAIAVLPLASMTRAGRALIIDRVGPSLATVSDGTYPLRVEVLAFAPQEPSGQVREWLVWLQSQE
jgi:hypothetical protein